jgi:hypothetical protein
MPTIPDMYDGSYRTRCLRPISIVVTLLITLTLISNHDADAQTTASSSIVPTFAGVTGDGSGVGLSWWAVKGATGYEVLRTPDPQRVPTRIASVSSTTLGYRDAQAVVGPVYYQLVAILAGGARATSAWFEYLAPAVKSATNSGADVVLSWSPVKSAPGGYEVWRTPNPRLRATRVGAVDGSTVTYRDKQAGTGGNRASAMF